MTVDTKNFTESLKKACRAENNKIAKALTRAFEKAARNPQKIFEALVAQEAFEVELEGKYLLSRTPRIKTLTEEKVVQNEAFKAFKAAMTAQGVETKIIGVAQGLEDAYTSNGTDTFGYKPATVYLGFTNSPC